MNTFPMPIDIAAIVYLVLAIIGLIIVYRILRRLILKIGDVWSHGNLFGGDLKTRLISLGIVAILFPGIFYALGNAIIHFIGNFFIDVPRDLFSNWQSNQAVCADISGDFRFCASQVGYGFVQAWTSALSDALNRFGPSYISYSKLVLMLAVWAGLALFLGSSSSDDDDNASGAKIRLQQFLDSMSATTKQNIMFFVILVLAGYLSIAAITAIPGLQETAVPSETINEDRLEQQLLDAAEDSQGRILSSSEFSEQLSDPFETLEPSDNTYYVNYLKSVREETLGLYQKLLTNVQTQTSSSQASAISAYKVSLIDRKGTQETAQHFLNLDAWYRRILIQMETRVGDCSRSISYVDDLLRVFLADSSAAPDLSGDQNLSTATRLAREACQLPALEPVPERPELGSNLGPFSYIASWLLQTESLPLAQIVGLLGFGLLGSAVSSLVRRDKKRHKGQPLVEELATVIIRGATAAVVVFLAVKGGLAIFTSGESDPNSYVLLLTCLVAAVFSEDVWQEAHKRLNKGLRGDDDDDDEPPAPPVPLPAAPVEANDSEVSTAPGSEEEKEEPAA